MVYQIFEVAIWVRDIIRQIAMEHEIDSVSEKSGKGPCAHSYFLSTIV